MIHYGDITKINGLDIPIVDVVCGGSPCQDLSVAGKRAGLNGERSGLFMEQIRLIKEIRKHDKESNSRSDDAIRPRYMVWENVPGTFSSNKGEDFRCVLEETAKIAEEYASIPRPEGGKWSKAGCIVGNGWSIAWRLHDAQFWGVPQRRKRLCLLADFNGDSAPKILFELFREAEGNNSDETFMGVGENTKREIQPFREGLSGNIEQGKQERKETTRNFGAGVNPSSYTLKIRGGREIDSYGKRAGKGALIQTELSGTLGVSQDQTLITNCLNPWDVQSKHIQSENGIAEALYSGECRGGGGESYVMQDISLFDMGESRTSTIIAQGLDSYNQSIDLEVAQPIRCAEGGDSSPKVMVEGVGNQDQTNGLESFGTDLFGFRITGDCVNSLTCNSNATSTQPTIMQIRNKNVEGFDAQMRTGGGNVPLVCYARQRSDELIESDVVSTQSARQYKDATDLVLTYGIDRASFNQGINAKCNFSIDEEKITTQVAEGPGAVTLMSMGHDERTSQFTTDEVTDPLTASDYKDPIKISYQSVVRRLTPLECERLQGYPDGWTNIGEWTDSKGKKHKDADSPRYKALGNSIALPFWKWLAGRIVANYERPTTMASLFDGIGAFPLVFSACGCKPLWASEIEEFPIAVTKVRFPEKEETNNE